MALLISDEGVLELLDKCLKDALSVNENYSLRLFKVNKTPDHLDIAADYTAIEANFTGYAAKTLTRAGWGAATIVSNAASTTYGTVQSWTAASTGNIIYGYFVLGSTSGKLLWCEKFGTPRSMGVGDVLDLTPVFTLRTR
jgi:hypothetical protein